MQACISSANMVTLWGFSKRYEMDMPYFDCRVSMPREDCLPVLRGEASGLRTLVGVERVPTKPDIVLLIVTVCTWSLVHFCIINKPWVATQKWTRHVLCTTKHYNEKMKFHVFFVSTFSAVGTAIERQIKIKIIS